MMPSELGRYQIIDEIGRGGMARVYRALDPRFEREVAVKVLPREVVDDPRFRARFEREAKVIAALEHPAIVPVYDFGDHDGQPYLVMRYMTGGSLRERLAEDKIPPSAAAALIRRVASALDYAHEHGIIHRDIKPGNILFDARGDPYLTDFGIVKMAQGGSTLTGEAIIGTPAYMSPEQAQGDATIDGRTDIYSLGVILFEMLTGEQPYAADTPISLALKHIREPIPQLQDFSTDVQANLQAVIDTAMAKAPADRFPTASQMGESLEDILHSPAPPYITRVQEQAGRPATSEDQAGPDDGDGPSTGDDETSLGATLQAAPSPTNVSEGQGGITSGKPTGVGTGETVVSPKGKLPGWAWLAGGIAGLAILATGAFLAFGRPAGAPVEPTPIPSQVAAMPVASPTVHQDQPAEVPPPWPEVAGPQPAANVAAFYYPWYGNPDVDSGWMHWDQNGHQPPTDIASDYFPMLGTYSSMDPMIIAQHFAWLRQAGVGVIVTSWWGPEDRTDQAVPRLLEIAAHYGLKVAFHIEPYPTRSPEALINHVRYLAERYGDHPAYYRTPGSSPWNEQSEPAGLFFLADPYQQAGSTQDAEPASWTEAIDTLHRDQLGWVLAGTPDPRWVEEGHFDGLYNYSFQGPRPGDPQAFAWARDLRPGAWYVPSVAPGFSAGQLGYPSDTYVPRDNGATYNGQWEAAVSQEVPPQLITINSFNQWLEGTAIEPAAPGGDPNVPGRYADFGDLGPLGYIESTREWVGRFTMGEAAPTYRVRVHIITTSDRTEFAMSEGGQWSEANVVSFADTASEHHVEGNVISLQQPLEVAEAGGQTDMVVDLTLAHLDPGGALTFAISRGRLGSTRVELYRFQGDEPALITTLDWSEIADNADNSKPFTISTGDIIG